MFQLAIDALIAKSSEHIEVERIFDSVTSEAGLTIAEAIKVCICFKSTYEFLRRRNKRLFTIEEKEVVLEKLYGSLTAFISRCEDLLQISKTNQQFLRYYCIDEKWFCSQ